MVVRVEQRVVLLLVPLWLGDVCNCGGGGDGGVCVCVRVCVLGGRMLG